MERKEHGQISKETENTRRRVEITMREKREETQESSYSAVLKPKYRKREHSKK